MTFEDARPLLDLLAAGFDLLAWDYRDFGDSAPVTRPYTMAETATDAVEIADWSTCRVMGVSFGGMVAQEFAVANPERVEGLALACSSAGGEGGSSYPLKKLLDLPPDKQAAAWLKVVDSRWDERWLERSPSRSCAGRTVGRKASEARASSRP